MADRTPDVPIVVYDADMNRVAHLPYAYNIGYEKKINQVWSATFYLPYDDPHASECLPLRFVEIYDGSVRIGLFRITTRKVSHTATRKAWWFQCEHVLATLNDSMLVDVHNAGSTGGTTGAIEYVLARQDPVRWELGQCDWSRNFLYRWENVTLLEALLEIPTRFGEDYQWTFDTTAYPWTINLISPSTTVAAYIDYSRNLQEITREEDARELYTRLWAYGQGVQGSTAQVSIRDVNPTGEDFIDADTIGTYGIIERVWVDQRYTDSQSLYDAAVERLERHKTPIYRYTIKAADIYRLTGEEIDKFQLGAYVMVDDEELGIETSDRVVAISKPDIQGKPGEVSIQLANRMRELTDLTDVIYSPSLDDVVDGGTFARVLSTSIEAGLIKLSAIPGGSLGAFPAPPSIAGLYLGASHMGYHDGSTWKTYMDIDGRFKLVGTDGYLEWDPSGNGSLSIKGDVDITGTISASKVVGGTLDFNAIGRTGLNVITNEIANGAVTDAKIDTLSVDKLTAGTLDGQYIILADGGYIAQGKTSYNDSNAGFWLGQGGVNALFNIGDANYYMKWTGTSLLLKGTIYGLLGESLNYDGHAAYNVSDIRGFTGVTSQWLDLRNDTWYGVDLDSYLYLGDPASLNSTGDLYLRASGDVIIKPLGNILLQPQKTYGYVELSLGTAPTTMQIMDWQSSGGSRSGWIKVQMGGVDRYIWLHSVD